MPPGVGTGLRPDGRAGAEEDTGEMEQRRQGPRELGHVGWKWEGSRLKKAFTPYFIELHSLIMLMEGALLTGTSPMPNPQDGCSISHRSHFSKYFMHTFLLLPN